MKKTILKSLYDKIKNEKVTLSDISLSISGLIMASGCGAKIAQVTVALCALIPSQKSLRSRRT